MLYAHAPAWALSKVVALRLHFDDSNSENGPLRVIPGSHAHGVLTDGDVLHYASTPETVAMPGSARSRDRDAEPVDPLLLQSL